jgi:membrane protein implicated in regulation of membrane protease activity
VAAGACGRRDPELGADRRQDVHEAHRPLDEAVLGDSGGRPIREPARAANAEVIGPQRVDRDQDHGHGRRQRCALALAVQHEPEHGGGQGAAEQHEDPLHVRLRCDSSPGFCHIMRAACEATGALTPWRASLTLKGLSEPKGPVMLTAYLFCLLVGGTFVAASTLLGGQDHGGDADADADADLDAGLDPDLDAEVDPDLDAGSDLPALAGHAGDAASAPWLPFLSMRFWTFFLAFFGLTGTLLSLIGSWPAALVAGAATGMGLGSGLGISYAIRRLRHGTTDSMLRQQDYIGATGRVLLPIDPGQIGKVRLQIHGHTIDFLAQTEDERPLAIHQQVLVYAIDKGVLMVTDPSPRQLSDPPPHESVP